MKEKPVFSKKLKGEDGYRTFSVRVRDETVAKPDELSEKTGRPRSEPIGVLLEYAIKNCGVR